MASLATVEDLVAASPRPLTDEQKARAAAWLLPAASTRIRDFCGRSFDYVIDDVWITRPTSNVIILRNPPIIDVSKVEALDAIGNVLVTIPSFIYGWDRIDKIQLGSWWRSTDVWVSLPSELAEDPSIVDTYRITYTHGYLVIPDTVRELCVDMVLRTLLSPVTSPGLASETIGQYSYRTDGQSNATQVSMLADDRDRLEEAGYRVRKHAGTTDLRR